MGSFISLVSYRLIYNIDIVFKRSNCVNCNHQLACYELIPIFSWLFQRGKCQSCKQSISIRYPVIELTTAFITYLIYQNFGISLASFSQLLTFYCLITLIITDFEHYIIPDILQIILIINAVSLNLIEQSLNMDKFIGGVAGLLIGITLKLGFLKFSNKDALGIGDIKLMGIVGLYIGIYSLPIFFFISGLLGIITGYIWKYLDKGNIFPFGPALAISLAICLLVPKIENKFLGSVSNITVHFIGK